jgi:hypothetical protein
LFLKDMKLIIFFNRKFQKGTYTLPDTSYLFRAMVNKHLRITVISAPCTYNISINRWQRHYQWCCQVYVKVRDLNWVLVNMPQWRNAPKNLFTLKAKHSRHTKIVAFKTVFFLTCFPKHIVRRHAYIFKPGWNSIILNCIKIVLFKENKFLSKKDFGRTHV